MERLASFFKQFSFSSAPAAASEETKKPAQHNDTSLDKNEPIEKEGALKRKSTFTHRWKEKWYVLQKNILFEYSSEKSRLMFKRYKLDNTVIVPIEHKDKEFLFVIKTEKDSVILTLWAKSEEELTCWINCLMKASTYTAIEKDPIEQPDKIEPPSKPLPETPSERAKREEEERRIRILNQRVAKIQALWRGWRCRKIYPTIVKLNKNRFRIVNELLETERSYLGFVAIAIEIYQKPMEELARAPKPLITTEDVGKIFSNIEIIYALHCMLRRDLEEKIQNWYPQQQLAPIFTFFCSSLKSYAQYVNNYDTAVKVLERYKVNSKFAPFLKSAYEKSGLTMDLFALLIMPVQRPPRLCMLLRDLLNKTWDGHADVEALKEAVGQMEAVTSFLNESKREAENRSKVFAIQQKIQETGREHILELIQPHRRYICEGSLVRVSLQNDKKRECYVFLFNDIILISKKVAANKGGFMSKTSTVKFVVDHSNQAVVPLDEITGVESQPDLKDAKFLFALISQSDMLIFSAESLERQSMWINNINQALLDIAKNKAGIERISSVRPFVT